MLHLFLCLVASPVLLAPIDALESMNGVVNVVESGRAVVATINGEIVGSIGVSLEKWWYAKDAYFLGDRWFFIYPVLRQRGVGALLLAEAHAMAVKDRIDLVLTGKLRRRANGILFTNPLVLAPDKDVDYEAASRRVLN
jgi:GNAT superfamily N-acetyltransferase